MIALAALIVVVLFSAVIGSTIAWMISRLVLDAMEQTRRHQARQAPAVVPVHSRLD